MANNTGIIFTDLFINNKEMFIDIFEKYYLQNKQKLDIIINQLNQVLTDYSTKSITPAMAEAFKNAWHNFEKQVLLNQADLQLIVAYRGAGGKNGQFSQIIKQSAVEETASTKYGTIYGINSGNKLIQESMQALKASEIEEFLQKHLNDFLNQLETPISKDEAIKLYKYHHQFLHKTFLEQNHPPLTGQKWRVPFYGLSGEYYFGGQGLGQAYDGFMNHLANHNRQVYDYLVYNGLTHKMPMKLNVKHSVFEEEGGVEPNGNFPQLLNESKNSTGWYTGGDIVIIDPQTMGVVYNIQLKTTTEKTQSVFGERVSEIRKFIAQLVSASPKDKAEKIFDFFLTSVSNKEDFNTLPQQTIDLLIQENLIKKLGLTI